MHEYEKKVAEILGNGTLNAAQATKFIDLIIDDALAMAEAVACLYWYQWPFVRWLISHPTLKSKPRIVRMGRRTGRLLLR